MSKFSNRPLYSPDLEPSDHDDGISYDESLRLGNTARTRVSPPSTILQNNYYDEYIGPTSVISIPSSKTFTGKSHALNVDEPLSPKKRLMLAVLRGFHCLVAAGLLVCEGAMEAYMFTQKINMAFIPLFACRVFLITAIVVLLLCDLGLPKNIHRHFPMYSNERTWKGLGVSQLAVALFVFGDPILVNLDGDRDESTFARILFPLILTASSVMVVVSLTYFIAGAVGGSSLKRRFLKST